MVKFLIVTQNISPSLLAGTITQALISPDAIAHNLVTCVNVINDTQETVELSTLLSNSVTINKVKWVDKNGEAVSPKKTKSFFKQHTPIYV